MINDGKCDQSIFNEECKFDGKDCCPNATAIGDGYCNHENLVKLCNYDGGDCCNPQKVEDGICHPNHLNRMCDAEGEWNDCSCDYSNLTRDGYCNQDNNKSNCLYDNFDCLCSNSTLSNGLYTNCKGYTSPFPFSAKKIVYSFLLSRFSIFKVVFGPVR